MESLRATYRSQRSRLRTALKSHGLKDQFQWEDVDVVWAWAKQWSSYAERRAEIGKLVAPLLDQLEDLERAGKIDDWGGGPEEWSNLEFRLSGLRDEMDGATELDQYQDVGRRGREIVIDVVNLMYQADMTADGDDPPRGSDSKLKFDKILAAYAIGTSHAELRKLMRSAWELNQKVTHGTITRVDAFAAAQATVLIVRTLAAMHQEGRPSTR